MRQLDYRDIRPRYTPASFIASDLCGKLVSETGGQVGVTRSPQPCLCTT
jgi:hypothetical protein